MSILIPYYKVKNLYVDAYLIKYLTNPIERISLVKWSVNERKEKGEVKPLSYYDVIRMLEEGYRILKSNGVEKEKLRLRDIAIIPLYNPGLLSLKKNDEITLQVLYKIYDITYRGILDNMKKIENPTLVWLAIKLDKDYVLINEKLDRVYSELFKSDEGFRNAILDLTR
ncbi:MAG: hypothetical protein JZD40_01840 [Sulfolobus sp.]|nr:hypothetical protein [Sulfolobus sp.]